MKTAFIPLALLLILGGCVSPEPPGSGPGNGQENGPLIVKTEFERIDKGYNAKFGIEKKNLVIKTQEEWVDVWENEITVHNPVPGVPEISFPEKMAIVVFMGSQSSGGYSINIKSAEETANSIIVHIESASPGDNCVTVAVATSPYEAISVQASDKEVVFREEHTVIQC